MGHTPLVPWCACSTSSPTTGLDNSTVVLLELHHAHVAVVTAAHRTQHLAEHTHT